MEGYEAEFRTLTAAAGRSIVASMVVSDDANPADDAQKRLTHVDDATATVSEASAVVQSMELEVHALPKSKRAELDMRVQQYKADLERMRQELRTARLAAVKANESSSRVDLLGFDPDASDADKALDGRARMMEASERLQHTTERIHESRRVAAETENIGAALLEDLDSQRQTISRTRENLSGMDGLLSRGRGYLDSMSRRNWINRVVLNAIGACIFLAGLVILYLRFRGQK